MIKTFEPFQSKIQLHIETGFLQRLWDRYVPVSSDSYDRISLIYLKGNHKAEEEPERQIQLIVNMILKNTLLQMNLKENQMLLTQNMVSRSLAFSTRLYLEQLKRADINVYRSLKRHIAYMEGRAEGDRRYRGWQKENQSLERVMKEYQILSDFSKRLTEFISVQSVEIEKQYAKELLKSLKKEKEFRTLLKNINEEEVYALWERLPGILAKTSQIQEDFRKEKWTVSQKVMRRFRYHTYRKLNVRLDQIQESYWEEIRTYLRERIFKTGYPEEYRVIAGAIDADTVLAKFSQNKPDSEAGSESNVLSENRILMDNIRKLEKEAIAKLTEQKQEIVKTERAIFEKYQDVFRSERFKNVFRLQENRESRIHTEKQKFEKLWKWSGVLSELEEQPDNTSIQELIEYIYHIEGEEEYKEFVRRLSDTVVARSESEQEESAAETQLYGGRYLEKSDMESAKLWEWSEVLLRHPAQITTGENPEVFFADESEESHRQYEEVTQTWKQQDLTDLRYLTTHLLKYVEKRAAFIDSRTVRTSLLQKQLMEDIKADRFLKYREELFYDSSIQELLQYIRQIKDEEEYERFVGELADTLIDRYRMRQEEVLVQTSLETQTESVTEQERYSGNDVTEQERYSGNAATRQERYDEETDAKLWEWSRVLLIHFKRERTSFVESESIQASQIQKQLSEEIRTGNIFTERRERPLDSSIQELLEYARQIDKAEEYEEFAGRLTDMVIARYEMEQKEILTDISAETEQLCKSIIQELCEYIRQIENEKEYREFVRELADMTVIRYQIEQEELSGEVKKFSEESDEKLWEWGKALLIHPKQELDKEKQDSLTGNWTEERTELRNLTVQLSDYIENEEIFTKTGRTLVYRDGLLHNPSVQELLQCIHRIDSETEYQRFAARLAETIVAIYQKEQERAFEAFVKTQEKNLERIDSQEIFESYPQLVYEIQKREKQKNRDYKPQLETVRHYSDLIQQDGSELYNNVMRQNKKMSYGNLTQHTDLKHALPEKGLGDSQSADRIHMQAESVQMKSLQKQLDVRLSEVEQKLSEAESREKAQLNVRDITEKVKRQLHEELHIERMRRGMS